MIFNSLDDVEAAIALIAGDGFCPNMTRAREELAHVSTGYATIIYGGGGGNRYRVERVGASYSLALSKGHLSCLEWIAKPFLGRAAALGVPLFDSAGIYLLT